MIIDIASGTPDFLRPQELETGSEDDLLGKNFSDIEDEEIFSDADSAYLAAIENLKKENAITSSPLSENPKKSAKSPKSSGDQRVSMEQMVMRFLRAELVVNIGKAFYVFDDSAGFYSYADQFSLISKMRSHLTTKEAEKMVYRNFEDAAKYLLTIEEIKLAAQPIYSGCILFDNGFFDITTGKRLPYDPYKTLCFYKINADFLPHEELEMPHFSQFLEDLSGGNKQVKYRVWEFLGYCLIPDMSGKCFFYLGTAPNSGKSLIADFLARLIGEEFVSAVAPQDFSQTFGLAPLLGKKLNLCMDMSAKKMSASDVSHLKKLTGGDLVSINEKFQHQKTIRSTIKFVFGSNHPLLLNDDDEALWERAIIVPFLRSTPKELQDKNLLDKIWEERDAIVTKAMKAARRLIKNNYIFSECAVADAMLSAWRCDDGYDVMRFISTHCIVGEGDSRTHTAVLYEAYVAFCHKNGISSTSEKRFSQILGSKKNLSHERWQENGVQGWGYSGIRLREEDDV